MYLKKIILQNFKGFGERTVMDFFPGIGALVGPNGCGKSNIVDAVKWVLGEQKVSEMRGDKMDDLIFSGSAVVGVHHYAEVEIVFDNTTKILALPQSEVSIMRRLYRSGEMEYFIGGEPCRLKDIHRLLFDTGLGRMDYSIIAQGSINKILQSSHHEKLKLLEEAASITKYRERHREYERKIVKVSENLKHVDIIFKDLSKRRQTLQKQNQASQEYFKIKTLLKKIELFQNLQKLKAIEKKHDLNHRHLSQFTQKYQTLAKHTEDHSLLRDQTHQSSLKASYALQSEEFKLKNELSVLHEKQKSLSERHHEKTLDLQTQTKQLSQTDKNLQEAARTLATTQKSITHHETLLAQARLDEKALRSQLDRHRSDHQTQQSTIASLDQALRKNEAFIAATRKSLDILPETLFNDLERLFPLSALLSQDKQAQKAPRKNFLAHLDTLREQLHTLLETHFATLTQSLQTQPNPKSPEKSDQARSLATLETSLTTLKQTFAEKFKTFRTQYEALLHQDSYVTGIVKVVETVYKDKDTLVAKLHSQTTTSKTLRLKLDQAQNHLKKLSTTKEALHTRNIKLEQNITSLVQTIARLRTDLVQAQRYHKERQAHHNHYQAIVTTLKNTLQALTQEKQKLTSTLATLQNESKAIASKLTQSRKNDHVSQAKLKKIEAALATYEQKKQSLDKQFYELSSEQNILEHNKVTLIDHTQKYLDENLLDYRTHPQAQQTLIKASFLSPALLSQPATHPKNITQPPLNTSELPASTPPSAEPLTGNDTAHPPAPINLKALNFKELERLIKICKERLSTQGSVNPLAEQELKELSEEYERIAKERTDIKASLKNLSLLAKQVSSESKAIFSKTFKQIAKNFSQLIKELFDGGTGKLVFKSNVNPEQSQVLISVQPRGKEIQKLDLFSGGEKSLIVLALMFAIFKTKPSPLCILDEADAALDDENISRFLKLIRSFQKQTQILVISHNRKTFSVFDYLYGISMREGISRIFSLKLPAPKPSPTPHPQEHVLSFQEK